VHKKLEEDTAGTADPSSPKGYSMPCDVTLSNKSWEKKKEGGKFGVMAFVFPNNP